MVEKCGLSIALFFVAVPGVGLYSHRELLLSLGAILHRLCLSSLAVTEGHRPEGALCFCLFLVAKSSCYSKELYHKIILGIHSHDL